MTDQAAEGARSADPVGRALLQATKALAIVGGLICGLLALMVTVSVTGRYLFSAPIRGDYDLLAIFTGVAIFTFLPYCQMVRGNVIVDFFTNNMAPSKKAALDAFGTLLYLVIAIVFTWRLYHGMLELRASGEVIASYDFYRWWTVPFNLLCMVVLIIAILYTLVHDIEVAMKRMQSAEAGPEKG
ncbi:MAG TPA: TRAP transporter small permease [Xanthobacteraceae bacterium]|nr:TRAP transporter small permease [Xanthobacteraceae bacterium]